MVRQYNDTSEAYADSLYVLITEPDYIVAPRGLSCYEKVNYQFVVLQPTSKPITTADSERNRKIAKYHSIERELYLAGELRASVWIEKASRFWKRVANPDGTINSNYGYLALYKKSVPSAGTGQYDMELRTQWEWASRRLREDPDTRQAYLRFSLPEHQWEGNKDQVCTMHMNFLRRSDAVSLDCPGEQLQACVVMRSCDVVRGLVYDMPWFIYLQEKMAAELKLSVGPFTYFAHSLHLYERDLETAKKMIGEII